MSERIATMAGYEFALNATASRDNVRITDYEWSMGNGDVVKGARAVYSYGKAGTYTVLLTVSDAAGNTAEKEMTVRVLPDDGTGKTTVHVTDMTGRPVPYADGCRRTLLHAGEILSR